jgi:protein ImuB
MRVACVLIRSFAVQLERRDRPELRGAPLVVGGAPHERRTVWDCSPDARRAGVQPGMPLRRALALCHEAVFVEPRPVLYTDTLNAIVEALENVSPHVEPPDALGPELGGSLRIFLDLTGMERLWPDEHALAAHIADGMHTACRLMPRIGIADGRAAAAAAAATECGMWNAECGMASERRNPDLIRRLASVRPGCTPGQTRSAQPHRHSAFQIVSPGHTPTFLADLSLDAVDLPADLRARLRLLGLRTLGALAALPGGAVAAQFGPAGVRAWETARGIDRRPFVPRVRHASVSDDLEFPAPTADQQAILAGARILLRRLLRRPEIGNRLVRRMAVRFAAEAMGNGQGAIEDSDCPTIAHCPLPLASFVFQEPTADPERMLFLLRHKLDAAALPSPVQRLTITLAEFCGERGHQEGLFAAKGRRRRQLEAAIRQLRSRYPQSPILRFVPVEPWSRIPERRMALATYEC